MIFSCEIALPPSSNGAYANAKRGRIKTQKHKDWKLCAGWEIKAARPPTFPGKYLFSILLPEKMRGDVSNRVKLAEDLLVELGVTPDDRHAIGVRAVRSAAVPNGRAVVQVESA